MLKSSFIFEKLLAGHLSLLWISTLWHFLKSSKYRSTSASEYKPSSPKYGRGEVSLILLPWNISKRLWGEKECSIFTNPEHLREVHLKSFQRKTPSPSPKIVI